MLKEKELENFELIFIGGPNKAIKDLKENTSKNVKFLGHISTKKQLKEWSLLKLVY